jgi:hypothetical protein
MPIKQQGPAQAAARPRDRTSAHPALHAAHQREGRALPADGVARFRGQGWTVGATSPPDDKAAWSSPQPRPSCMSHTLSGAGRDHLALALHERLARRRGRRRPLPLPRPHPRRRGRQDGGHDLRHRRRPDDGGMARTALPEAGSWNPKSSARPSSNSQTTRWRQLARRPGRARAMEQRPQLARQRRCLRHRRADPQREPVRIRAMKTIGLIGGMSWESSPSTTG